MSWNSADDRIRAAIIRFLKNKLSKFSLENWKLNEIPFDVQILSGLKILNLRHNLLTFLPSNMKFLNLSELDISHNSFDQLPKEISYLSELQALSCHHNRLEQIPLDFFDCLIKLEMFNCNHNKIKTIPSSISKCAHLKKLYCSYNEICELPESLSDCQNLIDIRCGYNCLQRIPDSLGTLKKLQTLILHKNQIECLPENIADWISLRVLDIAANSISVMPSEILQMNLVELHYEANPLLRRDPVVSKLIDEVLPLEELSLRVLTKELQNKRSYLHVRLKHFPQIQEMLDESGECALCGGTYRNVWIECVRFVKRNPQLKSTQASPSALPVRAAICSQTCFSSREHDFYGIANL